MLCGNGEVRDVSHIAMTLLGLVYLDGMIDNEVKPAVASVDRVSVVAADLRLVLVLPVVKCMQVAVL